MLRKTTLTLLLIVQAGLFNAAYADAHQPNSGLTPLEQRHEDTMASLRRQKEVLQIRHAEAKMIHDCVQMGIDCTSDKLSATTTVSAPQPEAQGGIQPPTSVPGGAEEQFMPPSHAFGDTSPKLVAIQNSSAKIKINGESTWAVVGDRVGDWKVIHIDASKIRLAAVSNPKHVKTLVLRW